MRKIFIGILFLLLTALPSWAETVLIPLHNGGAFANAAALEGYNTFESKAGGIRLADTIHDSYTKLMLHFDGTDGTTSVTDYSDDRNPVYFRGDGQLDTADKKFGTASYLGDGTGDMAYAAARESFVLNATESWSVDFWIKKNGVQPDWTNILSRVQSGAPYNGWMIAFKGNNDKVGIVRSSDGTGGVATALDLATGWHHIEIVHDDPTDKLYLFLDGMKDDEQTASTAINWTTQSYNLYVGYQDGFGRSCNCWIDEVRFSKGIARHTSNFTPPSAPYPDYATDSPATTGAWTALSRGTLDMSTARIVILKSGTVQAATSTDFKCQYAANGGALNGSWLTLQSLRAVSDITVTDTTNSIEFECQYNSDGTYQVATDYNMQLDFTPAAGGAGYPRRLVE